MKTAFTTFAILLFSIINIQSQERFTYEHNGLAPKYLVCEVEDHSSGDLYTLALNWIKKTYRNPDEVIKSSIDNQMIRFEGYKENLVCMSIIGKTCFNGTYTISLEFKDNRFKFEPIDLTYHIPPTQYSSTSYESLELFNGEYMYRKNGKLKNKYTYFPEEISLHFNSLAIDLLNYIANAKEEAEQPTEDW